METELVNILENKYFDVFVIILVLTAGYSVKRFWPTSKISTAWKTVIISIGLVALYTLIMGLSNQLTNNFWTKCFVSYTVATSFYELILKYITNFIKIKKEQ